MSEDNNYYNVAGKTRTLQVTAKYLKQYGPSKPGICPIHNTDVMFKYTGQAIEYLCSDCKPDGGSVVIDIPEEKNAGNDKSSKVTDLTMRLKDHFLNKTAGEVRLAAGKIIAIRVPKIDDEVLAVRIERQSLNNPNCWEVRPIPPESFETAAAQILGDESLYWENKDLEKAFQRIITNPGYRFSSKLYPTPISDGSESGLTFNLIQKIEATPKLQAPHWEMIMETMSEGDREVFCSFIWSIFEPTHVGVQALWLRGHGGDGKSILQNAIAEFLTDKASFTAEYADFSSGSFGLAGVIGKRLIYVPEVGKSARPFANSKIKSITGNDPVKVNKKFGDIQTAKLGARMWFISNFDPIIGEESSETRRALYIAMEKRKPMSVPNLQGKVNAETHSFLQYCKWIYFNRTDADGFRLDQTFKIYSQVTDSYLANDQEEREEDLLYLYSDLFEFTGNEDDYIQRAEFKELINTKKKISNADLKKLKELFLREYGVDDMNSENGYRLRVDGKRVKVYRGMRKKVWS